MDLGVELRKAGVEWCIDLVQQDDPGTVNQRWMTRVRLADLASLPAGADAQPATMDRLFRPSDEHTVQQLLSVTLMQKMPNHPVRRAYLDSVGNTPVKISESLLGDHLAECLHTALRKLVQSKESNIQWNAIRYLRRDDWCQMLDLVREEIRLVMKDVTEGKRKVLLRRDVGQAIKRALVDRADEVTHRGFETTHRNPRRTDVETFALICMQSACSLTDNSDWTFGWTGYLCEEADEAATESAAEVSTP